MEKKCEEMKNQVNQIIEEKGEQAEILKEKLKQISMLSEDLQKETEDDKSTMEEARTQCQSMLDEIEEYEVRRLLKIYYYSQSKQKQKNILPCILV
ncbi:unnamed protein product [Trichobilharzia regenti]|nr:unnamed protein product [Trichobilharzia regenti]